jgi:hypothetical protein
MASFKSFKRVNKNELTVVDVQESREEKIGIVTFDNGQDVLFSWAKHTSFNEETEELDLMFVNDHDKLAQGFTIIQDRDGRDWIASENNERPARPSIASLRR